VSAPEPREMAEWCRAAAALVLAVAEDRRSDIGVILGLDDPVCDHPAAVRLAGTAYMLACWIATDPQADPDPARLARHMIEHANREEAGG
jgi:hypothetical protein